MRKAISKQLLAGGMMRMLKLWDVPARKEVATLRR